jgi:hypothetical protein
MKTYVMALLVTGIVVSVFFPSPSYGAEEAQAIADHLAMAASYEEKAAQQDMVIAEHTKMKVEWTYPVCWAN